MVDALDYQSYILNWQILLLRVLLLEVFAKKNDCCHDQNLKNAVFAITC